MNEAWICPKCNIGVAPHCDACPNCTNNLNLLGIPIKIDPSLPPDEWRIEPNPLNPPHRVGDFPPFKTITSTPAITTPYTMPYDPNITVKWSFTQ